LLCVFSAAKILPGWIAACGTIVLLASAIGVAGFALDCLFRDSPILSDWHATDPEFGTEEQDNDDREVRETNVEIVS
jgi:hypothetical protein